MQSTFFPVHLPPLPIRHTYSEEWVASSLIKFADNMNIGGIVSTAEAELMFRNRQAVRNKMSFYKDKYKITHLGSKN